jgi:hypothetical protein
LASIAQVLGQSPQDAWKDTGAIPMLEATMARRRRRVPIRYVLPLRSRAQNPENAVQDLAIVAPRAPAPIRTTPWLRDQRLEDVPLFIREVHCPSSAPSMTLSRGSLPQSSRL